MLGFRSIRNYRKALSNGLAGKVVAILGQQWGDEGKGKLVDEILNTFDICARFNGGANAGHTVEADSKKFILHLLPCGVIHPAVKNVLGNGVVIHIPTLFEEIKQMTSAGISLKNRLFISNRANIIIQSHFLTDATLEKSGNIGTTKRGIGPSYTTKMLRKALRMGDLQDWTSFCQKYNTLVKDLNTFFGINFRDAIEELDQLKKLRENMLKENMIVDTSIFLNKQMEEQKRVLIEGANATMLDVDFGTYPFVTSSSTNIGGACTGLGIPPNKIDSVIGVVKAYTTRVGGGPFPTEQLNSTGEFLQKEGHEVGATTGRKRRCGWLDIPVIKYAKLLNDPSGIMITKLDILDKLPEIKIGAKYLLNGKPIEYMPSTIEELAKIQVEYKTFKGWMKETKSIRKFKDLPTEAQEYINFIEEATGIKVSWIGVGAKRGEIILK